MTRTLLYHGPLWDGSTSLQRSQAFSALDSVSVIAHDTGARVVKTSNPWHRMRWKVGWPPDVFEENARLLSICQTAKPDVVFIDNSRVIRRSTLRQMRDLGVMSLVYYSPDDIVGRHNLSMPLRQSLTSWDVVFTTKTFNVEELRRLGVRRPTLIGKAFDPAIHRPLSEQEVGSDYERFDAVFVGSYEAQRCASINAIAAAGFSVVVYGSDKGGWSRNHLHPSVELRKSVFGWDYLVGWHVGRVALCFLRKRNRDRITQRTMEIAAMGRPMLAERTDEHDRHFSHGDEYCGFSSDSELVATLAALLSSPETRSRLSIAAVKRCRRSGYSTLDRAREMVATIEGDKCTELIS